MKSYFNSKRRSFRSLAQCIALLASVVLLSPVSVAAEKTQAKAAAVKSVVSINKANAETIAATLNGVGMTKAQAIVSWRKQNGGFKRVEQLLEVKGIGEKTLERNRSKISL